MAHRRGGAVGLGVVILAVAFAPAAKAAAPALELPFICGASWKGTTGSTAHRNYEIDFNMTGTSGNEDLGEPVLAAAAGTVAGEGGATSAYGNYLEIDHGGGYSTLYAHLDTKVVHNGDVVRQGEVIGTVGNTDGNASGPLEAHLHFEFRNRGSGEGYPDYIRPASFHGDPFDYATGEETYVSQNCGTSDRASKSIDGDKYDDAIGVDPDGVVWVYHGSSGGGFGTATRLGPGWGAFSRIGIGDSNADGYADLWAVGSGTLYYWNNRHDGTFSAADAVGPGWSAFEWVAFADVTGDGRTDVLARDGGNMYLYPGQGNGAFATRSLVGSGWSSLLRHTAADADDDRDGDIWATNSAGELYFWKRGSAGYATAVQVGTGWNAFRQMTSMDINGDGKADLIAIRTSDNTLWRWLGTGTGTFAQGTQIGHGWAGYTLAAN